MPEYAVSAFISAVRARCCATDSPVGVMVLRSCGDAERARTSLSRLEYVEFGVAGTTCTGELGGAFAYTDCTVTPGGGPVPRVEDALSSMVPPAATGELTNTDCSDRRSLGEDMFAAEIHHKFTPN